MTTTTLDAKVHDFLAQKRIAVAGVSRSNSHQPAGAWPMMYGDRVDFGHTCVRWLLKLTGGLPT